MATVTKALTTAAVVLASYSAGALGSGLSPAEHPSSGLKPRIHSRGRDNGDLMGMEDPLSAEAIASYGEPTDGPLEAPMEAPVQVVPGPAAAEPEGSDIGAPATSPEPSRAEEGDLRLVEGRVIGDPAFVVGALQVVVDGAFGAVCNTKFNDVDAAVACRQLGFAGGEAASLSSILPVFNVDLERDKGIVAPFVLENLNCTGAEERLVDCPVATETGLDEYTQEEYSNYLYTTVGLQFGGCDAIEPNGYAVVRCGPLTSAEASELSSAADGTSEDEESEGVTPPGAEEGDVRLVEEATVDNWRVGRLELFFAGSFAPVCPDGFSVLDATVACRALGLGAGALTPNTPEGTLPQTRISSFARNDFLEQTGQRVVLPESPASGPNCDGTEAGLLECEGARSGPGAAGGDCTFAVLIACVAEEEDGVEGALRLTTTGAGDIDNDPGAGVGVLEVFHAGAWGTLCNGDPAPAFVTDYDRFGPPDDRLTEEAALVACRQLGFEAGEFRGVQRLPEALMRRPAWLADLPCATGSEASVLDCGNLAFGDTSSCGLTQRLLCSDGEAEFPFLTPRLVESEVDPNGQWMYGRLEVFDGLEFIPVSDFAGRQELGRRGAQVVCRQMGFATGGQALAGSQSALPLLEATGRGNRLGNIICSGDEATLAECEAQPRYGLDNDYDIYLRSVEENAVALVCYNPSGCEANITSAEPVPQQGDIRLVNLVGNDNPTQLCDEVHLGGVEFFNEGQWGRICVAGLRTRSTWTVDATVICRQLGFPFGSLMDNREDFALEDVYDYNSPGLDRPTWASIVFCKGTEERLDECAFIEDFGAAGTDIRGRPNLAEVACSDADIVSVICRRFPMEESDVIRRR